MCRINTEETHKIIKVVANRVLNCCGAVFVMMCLNVQ